MKRFAIENSFYEEYGTNTIMKGGKDNMMHGDGFGMGGLGFGWLFMVLFTVLAIVAVVYLIKYVSDKGDLPNSRTEDAIEILKKRFARGEIDKSEYEEKMKLIGKREAV